MPTAVLILFIFIFALVSLVFCLDTLFKSYKIAKKILLLVIIISITGTITIYSSAYTFKQYISKRQDIFYVVLPYNSPKNCHLKIKKLSDDGYSEEGYTATDSGIGHAYMDQFYKYCIVEPNVTCDFYRNDSDPYNSGIPSNKCTITKIRYLARSNLELQNTFPYNLLYNLY